MKRARGASSWREGSRKRVRAFVATLVILAPWSLARDEPPKDSGGPENRPVVVWSRGELSVGDLRSWLLAKSLPVESLGSVEEAKEVLEDLALLVDFAEAARERGLEDDRELRLHLEGARQDDLARGLRRHLAESVEISDAEVRKWLQEKPDAFRRPRRLSLRQIYLPFEEAPEVVLRRLEELREAVARGEDFAELARRESRSQTAAWGGRMGFVDPDELPESVAEVVRALAKGEVSAPIAHGEGASIFFCENVREGSEPTREEVEEKFRSRLKTLSASETWSRVADELIARARPKIDPTSADVVLEMDGARLDRTDLEILARRRGSGGGTLEAEAATTLLREWALGVAASARAEELGLDGDPARQARERWRRLEALARVEWSRRLEGEPLEPGDGELLAFFRSRRERYRKPAMVRLQVIDFGRPESEANLGRARAIEAGIHGGELDFERVAREHSVHASAASGGVLGWKPRRSLAQWGPLGRRLLEDLEVGETTPLLNLESGLWLVRLLEERDEAERSFEDVEELVGRDWVQARLPVIRQGIRDRSLREGGFRVFWPPLRNLRWTTAREVENYGFDVYRATVEDGPFERRTVEPIPGAGTVETPQSYTWDDPEAEPDLTYYYYVESISTSGRRRRLTPVWTSEGVPFEVVFAESEAIP